MTHRQAVLRYTAVGVACAGLNIALVGLFDAGGLHFLAATALAFPFVLVFGYALHVRFTFAWTMSWSSFWRYALAMAANYPLLAAMLLGLCGLAGIPAAPATAIATLALFAWNYLSSRWAILVAGRPWAGIGGAP